MDNQDIIAFILEGVDRYIPKILISGNGLCIYEQEHMHKLLIRATVPIHGGLQPMVSFITSKNEIKYKQPILRRMKVWIQSQLRSQ
jgi:hypothetical protein